MSKFAIQSVTDLSHRHRPSLLHRYDGPTCQTILPSVNGCDTLMFGPVQKRTFKTHDK